MEPVEQLNLIDGLILDVLTSIRENVKAGKIPNNWDGYELRQYIADRFNREAYMNLGSDRARKYKKLMLENNL